MRCGLRLPTPRHAVLATSIARHLDSQQEAGEICDDGFNTPVAQWALHVRGRTWVEGRIAKCPRLQHIGRQIT